MRFDPRKSKYSGLVEGKNIKTKLERKDAPVYLQDEQTFQDETKQSFEVANVEDVKQIQRAASEKVKKSTKTAPSATTVALLEHKKRLQTFDRFNEDFVKTYKLEELHKNMP